MTLEKDEARLLQGRGGGAAALAMWAGCGQGAGPVWTAGPSDPSCLLLNGFEQQH